MSDTPRMDALESDGDASPAELRRIGREFETQLAAARRQAASLHNALVVLRAAMEQGGGLDTHVAANGPTIREVIDQALAQSEPGETCETCHGVGTVDLGACPDCGGKGRVP